MEKFLRDCGLESAIDLVQYHKLEMDQLDELSEKDMVELFPQLGSRLKFKKAILERASGKGSNGKKRGGSMMSTQSSPPKKPKQEIKQPRQETVHTKKTTSTAASKPKRDRVSSLLKDDKSVAELYQLGVNVLKNAKLFSVEHGFLPGVVIKPEWKMINFATRGLICPICLNFNGLQVRSERDAWNVGNFKRHMAKHEDDEEIMPTTVLEVHYSESECDQSFETDPIDNEPISPLPITPVPNNDESITGTEPVDCRPLEAEAEESTFLPKDQDGPSQISQEGSNDVKNDEEANGIGIEIPNVDHADDQEPIIDQHSDPVKTSSIDDVGDDSSHPSNTEQIPMELDVSLNAAQISAESVTDTEPVDFRPLEAEVEESTSLPKDQHDPSQISREGSNDIKNDEEANGIGIEIPNVDHADDQEPIIDQHSDPVKTSSIDDVGDDSSHPSNTEQIPMELDVSLNAAQISAESVTDTEPVDFRPLEAEVEESTSLPKDQHGPSQISREGSNDIKNDEEANGIGIEIPNVDHADDQEPIIDQHSDPVKTSSIDDVGDDSSHPSNTEQIPMELGVSLNAAQISAESVTDTEPVDFRPLEAEVEESTSLPKDQHGPSQISREGSNDIKNDEEANGIGIEIPNVDHADDQEPIIDQHSDPVKTSSIDDVGDDSSHPSNTEQIPMELGMSLNAAQISAESVTDTEPVDFRPLEAEVEESTSLPKDQHGPSQISREGSNDIKNDEEANGIGIEIPNVDHADDQEPIIDQHSDPVKTSSIDDVGDDSSHPSNTEQILMELGVSLNAAQISAESVTDTEPVDFRPLEAEVEESTSLPKDQHDPSQISREGSNDIKNDEDQWRRPGVKFGWMRSGGRSKYYPGFLQPNKECLWIDSDGFISPDTFTVKEYQVDIPKKFKIGKIRNVQRFNKKNGTSYN